MIPELSLEGRQELASLGIGRNFQVVGMVCTQRPKGKKQQSNLEILKHRLSQDEEEQQEMKLERKSGTRFEEGPMSGTEIDLSHGSMWVSWLQPLKV